MGQGGAGRSSGVVAGLASVSAVALALAAVHVPLVLASGRPAPQALLVDATLFGLLLYLWYWGRANDVAPSDPKRIGGWLVLGTLVFGGGALYRARILGGSGGFGSGSTVLGFAVAGASAGLVIGINDVNRLLSARKEQAHRERAERLTEALTVLNRVLRHDVRNDAHLIVGYADLIAADHGDPGDPDSSLDDYLEKVRNRATDAVERSEKARDIERILFDDRDALETVDLAERLEEGVDRLTSSHPRAEADLDLRVEGRTTVTAHGLVDSALDNVLENAVEHNDRERPRVAVRVDRVVRDGEPYVRVAVGDDGPGIPPSERRVLERGAESPLEHSGGLGLWLVNWTVRASGGVVDIADREPRGTDVLLHFRPESTGARTVSQPTLGPMS